MIAVVLNDGDSGSFQSRLFLFILKGKIIAIIAIIIGSYISRFVVEIITEILPLGLVAEVGEGPSSGGRRPIVLEFQGDVCVILGVEV